MARQIIVLENQIPGRAPTDPITYRYAFWLSVPVTRQTFFANATATSAVRDATAPELTAIQNGSIKESVGALSAAPGTTLTVLEATLVTQFTAAQTALNSAAQNPWDHYGTFWDGTSWTIITVA
jgi:hypothetical protein